MSEKSSNASGSAATDLLDSTDPDTLDAVFDVLSDRRRRYVLHCLDEYDNPMALADLADEVAAHEYGTPITQTSAEEVKRIYVSLYHTHVPKLEEADLVEYNQERDLVSLASERTELEEYAEAFS